MNLGRDYNPDAYQYQFEVERHCSTAPIVALALAISQNEYLLGVHMSDNGLRIDRELFLDVLDMFGLDEKCLEPPEEPHSLNRRVGNTQLIRDAIKKYTGAITAEEAANTDR